MKILICGSRSAANYEGLKMAVRYQIQESTEKVEIISGGANGADKMAERLAKDLDLKITVVRPNWCMYGKSAGMIRNGIMIDMEPDLVIACWDKKSAGTRNTVSRAKEKNIPTVIIPANLIPEENIL